MLSETELPLSFAQEQLWFIDRFAPGQGTYNLPHAIRLSGPLDTAALGRAIDQLAARHETLRTRLVTGADGSPVAIIDPPAAIGVEPLNLTWAEPEKQHAWMREFIGAEVLRPFSLADGPLLRLWLAELAAEEHMLLLVIHHTVFDGQSLGVLVRDLAALYRAEASGEPAGLPELTVQYADYALWERARLQDATLAELEQYWQKVMAGFETLAFPTDRPRPVIEDFDGGLVEHLAGPELLSGLGERSQHEGTTVFVALMAALQTLLLRHTGQTDIVVGTASSRSCRPELAPLIMFLVSTLPIRVDLSGGRTFTELLARTREACAGAFVHQELPFAKLVQALQLERDPSRAPVFQIALTYDERGTGPGRGGDVHFANTELIVGFNAAKVDLAFVTEARPAGLWFECSYKSTLFDAATVRRILGHLEVLLHGVVADPQARLSALPLLTQAELAWELTECNDTAASFPQVCIHEGFQAQAARTPDAVAAEFDGESLSYAELDRQSSQIAHRLGGLGVGPEVLVGVCMRTGLRRLAALLGIWKAG